MKLEWKKLVLYAIFPAFIAGLFSIAPKLYDIIIEPKAKLEYFLTSGPELQVHTGYRRILSIVVSNSGKKPLSMVRANLMDIGQLETYKVQESSGLKALVSAEDKGISVDVAKFHPGEKFTISAMVLLPVINASPRFTLRSEEVLGKPAEEKPGKEDNKLDLIGAILAGVSVFVMALTFMLGGKPLLTIITGKKQSILFYIPARLKLPAISNQMRFVENYLSYLRMSDILLAHGLIVNGEERKNTIKALKCLLLIKVILDSSLSAIIHNIKTLEGNDYREEEINLLRQKAIKINNEMELRRQIDKFVENDRAFLTSSGSNS